MFIQTEETLLQLRKDDIERIDIISDLEDGTHLVIISIFKTNDHASSLNIITCLEMEAASKLHKDIITYIKDDKCNASWFDIRQYDKHAIIERKYVNSQYVIDGISKNNMKYTAKQKADELAHMLETPITTDEAIDPIHGNDDASDTTSSDGE